MDKVNELLDLDPEERGLFLKYRAGYNGPSNEDKFLEYFRANSNTHKYVTPDEATAAAPPGTRRLLPQSSLQRPPRAPAWRLGFWLR